MLAQEALSHFLPQFSTWSWKGEWTKSHSLYLRVFVPMGGKQWDPTEKETHAPFFKQQQEEKESTLHAWTSAHCHYFSHQTSGGKLSLSDKLWDGRMRFSLAQITDFMNAPAIEAPCIVFVFCWVSRISNGNEAIKRKGSWYRFHLHTKVCHKCGIQKKVSWTMLATQLPNLGSI